MFCRMQRLLRHLLVGRSYHRRSLSAALLAAYIVTATGAPLPLGGHAHSDELYPCANCDCGCASAEQCWRSCCCHTLAERFAWAREHGVRPPEYAIAQARLTGIDLAWMGIPKCGSACGPTKPACCTQAAAASTPACCQKKAATCCAHGISSCCAQHHDEPNNNSTETHQIVAWRALACHGQSMNWLAAVPTLIVVRPEVSHVLPIIAWLGPATSETAECIVVDLDVPPPERA